MIPSLGGAGRSHYYTRPQSSALPGRLAQMEERRTGEHPVDLHLTVEREDYVEKRKKIEEYLDKVKKIARPGCSPEVLKLALSSMSSLISILSTMSSSTILHASL